VAESAGKEGACGGGAGLAVMDRPAISLFVTAALMLALPSPLLGCASGPPALRDREVVQLRLLGSGAHRTEVGALQAGAALARDPAMQRIGDEALSVRR
jgi:hypothetical protein